MASWLPLVSSPVFYEKKLLKNDQSLHYFVCADSKQRLYCLFGAFCQFYVEKCPEDVEDVDDSKLCRSTPLRPVRCPLITMQQHAKLLFSSIQILLDHQQANKSIIEDDRSAC